MFKMRSSYRPTDQISGMNLISRRKNFGYDIIALFSAFEYNNYLLSRKASLEGFARRCRGKIDERERERENGYVLSNWMSVVVHIAG